jgi:hypothetical protein
MSMVVYLFYLTLLISKSGISGLLGDLLCGHEFFIIHRSREPASPKLVNRGSASPSERPVGHPYLTIYPEKAFISM